MYLKLGDRFYYYRSVVDKCFILANVQTGNDIIVKRRMNVDPMRFHY